MPSRAYLCDQCLVVQFQAAEREDLGVAEEDAHERVAILRACAEDGRYSSRQLVAKGRWWRRHCSNGRGRFDRNGRLWQHFRCCSLQRVEQRFESVDLALELPRRQVVDVIATRTKSSVNRRACGIHNRQRTSR